MLSISLHEPIGDLHTDAVVSAVTGVVVLSLAVTQRMTHAGRVFVMQYYHKEHKALL